MISQIISVALLLVVTASKISCTESVSTVQGSDISVATTLPGNVRKHRQLQYSNGNTCGITGFSVYNSIKGIWEPVISIIIGNKRQAQFVLQNYSPDLKINMQTHVDMSGCAEANLSSTIGCVKTRQYNSTDYYDYSPPYTLYPANDTVVTTQTPTKFGLQFFSVELFESSSCDGPVTCFDTLVMNLVKNATTKIQIPSLKVAYFEMLRSPTIAHGQQYSNVTCQYLKKAIQNNFIVPGSSLRLSDDDWKCQGLVGRSSNTRSGLITYNINLSFITDPIISVFDNSDPPQASNVTSYIRGILLGKAETMWQYAMSTNTSLSGNMYNTYTTVYVSV